MLKQTETYEAPVAFAHQKQLSSKNNSFNHGSHNTKNQNPRKGKVSAEFVRNFLIRKFGRLPFGEWVNVRCFHHRDFFGNSLRVNTLTGKFCCTGCGINGSGLSELVGICRNLSDSYAYSFVAGETKYA